jgi:type VI secretion system protein ImpB
MAGSIYDKKARIRPPRVHISYDVELNGAQVKKELPFVVGVMADFSGNPSDPLPRPRDRKFVEIDRDNFDDILKSTKPRAAFKVANTLQDDGSELRSSWSSRSWPTSRPTRWPARSSR